MNKQKEFEILVKTLMLASYHFSINKAISEEFSQGANGDQNFLWSAIQLSLEQSYLLGLAKFFEKPKGFEDTVSIYYFFDFGHADILQKLKRVRDKMISHSDRGMTKDSLLVELKLDLEDIETLFRIATEAVEKLKSDFGYSWDDHTVTGVKIDDLLLRRQLRDLFCPVK